MSNNDGIALTQYLCPVCGIIHEHNAEILIHKKLKPIPEKARLMGHKLCEEHDKLFKQGYVALVVADEAASTIQKHEDAIDTIKLEDAYRTSYIVHMRFSAFNTMFNVPIKEDQPMVFIDKELFVRLKEMEGTIDES